MKFVSATSSESLDGEFIANRDLLTWRPWVGANYSKLSPGKRLLIVGESHYIGEKDPAKISTDIQQHHDDWSVTREAVINGFLKKTWKNRTYPGIQNLLIPPGAPDHTFWDNVCFYNFVQRIMPSPKARPTSGDQTKGWKAYLKVVELLQPDHCLFIGVKASDHFNRVMRQESPTFTGARKTVQVGSTWGRRAAVNVAGRTLPIHFIKHSAMGFSADKWRDYLQRQDSEMMRVIDQLAKPSSATN